jgi:hypothetical protein
MFFQQSAELSVLRPQGSLCIAHTVMIADRHDARHTPGVSGLSKASRRIVGVPAAIVPDLEHHLAVYVAAGPDALDFPGIMGGPIRR